MQPTLFAFCNYFTEIYSTCVKPFALCYGLDEAAKKADETLKEEIDKTKKVIES